MLYLSQSWLLQGECLSWIPVGPSHLLASTVNAQHSKEAATFRSDLNLDKVQ